MLVFLIAQALSKVVLHLHFTTAKLHVKCAYVLALYCNEPMADNMQIL